jgi:CMP-N,N'-diacetyllegionaminic acid synthase
MNILITICTRGGSKGIPGKNIKPLNGKKLIGYTIEKAQQFSNLYQVAIGLSTDSAEIKKVAAEFGLVTDYIRPNKMADDKAGKMDAIRDLLSFMEKQNSTRYDFVMDLDVTSPMRTVDDLGEALKLLIGKKEALNIFSVSPAGRNPYFNMVEENDQGYVQVVKNIGDIKSRQHAPTVYDMNASFYIFRRSYFEENWEISITDRSLAYVMKHHCFDLDHQIDFTIMEIMIREKLLDFEL